MTEQDIRQWAWDEMKTYRITNDDGSTANTTHRDRLRLADELAAWTMSGKLPDPAESIVE